jgi:hypothetical protein
MQKVTSLHRGLKGGSNVSDNYFIIGAAADEETPGCRLRGNVIAMVRDDRFCIKVSLRRLE